jgi:hypothetical protein
MQTSIGRFSGKILSNKEEREIESITGKKT